MKSNHTPGGLFEDIDNIKEELTKLRADKAQLLEALRSVLAILEQPACLNLKTTNAIVAGDLIVARNRLHSAISKATN